MIAPTIGYGMYISPKYSIDIVRMGYVAIDFYDGSIMYDTSRKVVTICDIDFFRKSPTVNDMGRMWGSSRFMSLEEYKYGEKIDEISNVFMIGKMVFSILTDSDLSFEKYPLSLESFHVLEKATKPNRCERYTSITEFKNHWLKAISL